MPLLVGKHVEALAQNKPPHAVKSKPREEIGSLRDLTGCDIGLNKSVKLVDERQNLLFIMR